MLFDTEDDGKTVSIKKIKERQHWYSLVSEDWRKLAQFLSSCLPISPEAIFMSYIKAAFSMKIGYYDLENSKFVAGLHINMANRG